MRGPSPYSYCYDVNSGNGKRINTFNIGRNQSERKRKEIEQRFGLVKATCRNIAQVHGPAPVLPQRVKYGISETKRSITNVLDALNTYKYSSFAELNKLLKPYNIMAEKGLKQGRDFHLKETDVKNRRSN
jgi:hypothetical protein